MEERYIVQDLDTFEFLYPERTGGIGLTPYLKLAGHFSTRADAMEAGIYELGSEFAVFAFFVPQESNKETKQ